MKSFMMPTAPNPETKQSIINFDSLVPERLFKNYTHYYLTDGQIKRIVD